MGQRIAALSNLKPFGRIYERLAFALSEISYTLYAIHFPILAAVYFTALAPKQFQPGAEALMVVSGLFVLSVASAALFWWCFERNTSVVRRWMVSLFSRTPERARHGI